MSARRAWVAALTAAACMGSFTASETWAARVAAQPVTIPARSQIDDREYWTLIAELSEPNGTFRSDNLLSNESRLQYVIPDLLRVTRPGGAYLGVGPEQNFTYIAALRPAIAFIIDVRRGNLQLHLMYKALFELSSDRADFVSRLFSKKRPDDLRADATVTQLFDAFADVDSSQALYDRNWKAIQAQLTGKHGFPLSEEDLRGIEYVYHAFFTFGPAIHYSSTDGVGPGYRPTYADLMMATDGVGAAHSFLSSEDAFGLVKGLENHNLLVPVVGDFAGSRAIRAVAGYLRRKQTTVQAFYLSNVEQYLRLERVWGAFCGNAARLPIDETSTFIRAGHGGRYARGTALTAEISAIGPEVEGCDRRP